MINRNSLQTEYLKLFILDEADEMLSEGFKDQVYEIFKKISGSTQVAIFSATLPDVVLENHSKIHERSSRNFGEKGRAYSTGYSTVLRSF